jgi:phosphatidate cytidylyltransferase
MFFSNYTNLIHNDCHTGNFLFHKIKPGGYFHYNIFGIDYYLENLGYLWVIWDFGLTEFYNLKPINTDYLRIIISILYDKKYYSNTEFEIIFYLIDKILTYDHARFILIGASIFWIFIAPLFLAFKIHPKNFYFSSLIGWMLIIPLIVALNYLIQLSPWAVLLVLTTIWLADSGAYFFGKQFGKRKLAPSISPGKTWEGFIGALFVVSLFSITLTYFGFVNSYESILFFILILLLSVEGDLFESYIKRVAKVKDSGDLIPGHGGVLDRIDSLCSSLPLATLILVSPSFFGQLI